jgi:hypothetical protein
VGVSGARVVVGPHLAEFDAEFVPDDIDILVKLEDADEFGPAAVSHGAHPNVPGEEVHENGGADIPIMSGSKECVMSRLEIRPGSGALRRGMGRCPRDEPSQVTRGELFDALYRARQGSELFFVLRTEAAVESSRVGEGSVMAFALASAGGGW